MSCLLEMSRLLACLLEMSRLLARLLEVSRLLEEKEKQTGMSEMGRQMVEEILELEERME